MPLQHFCMQGHKLIKYSPNATNCMTSETIVSVGSSIAMAMTSVRISVMKNTAAHTNLHGYSRCLICLPGPSRKNVDAMRNRNPTE